jgi:MFS family permease
MRSSNAAIQPATRRSVFGALRHRDFRLFWLGACLSFIGSWVQMVSLGLFVYHQTGSKAALGWIGLAGGLPTTLFMLFGGVIADRANKRTLVLATQSLFAANAFLLAALTGLNIIQLWHIIALSLVNGLVFAIDGPARQAMIYDLVGEEDLATGIALQSAAFNAARVIGPVIGSLIYVGLGPAWCFFTNGISFSAILVAILLIRTDLTRRGEASGSVWLGFVEGIQHLRRNTLMRHVVTLTAVTSICAFSVYSTLMPAFAKDMLGIEEHDRRYGFLFSAIGFGALCGVYFIGRFSAAQRRGLLMLMGAVLFSLSLMALSRTSAFALAVPLLVAVGMSAIGQLATANALTQSLAPEAFRGRAVSAHMFAMAGLQPFGSLIAGAVAERWGVSLTLALGSGIFLSYIVLMLFRQPEVIRLK